jgi:predicted DNA-binding antitoxin AbrB/MazE fold protein
MTVRAIYKNGVFRPTQPVDLPEDAVVEVVLPTGENGNDEAGLDAIYQVLGERYHSGRHDIAERHNEHQP